MKTENENNNVHPKRRKVKDNPYTLIRYENHYFVQFRDVNGTVQKVEVDRDVYDAMDCFELEELVYLNEWDRHIEHEPVFEKTLPRRITNVEETTEEITIRHIEYDEVRRAVMTLSTIQRQRLRFYFDFQLNTVQISEIEGSSQQAVSKSILAALKKIKNFF